MAKIYNEESNTLLSGTSDNDYIQNGYSKYENGTYTWHASGSNVTISGGDGDDYINNSGSNVTISGGTDSDSIFNNCYLKSDGSIYYYTNSNGSNVLFQYSSGDGNDVIYGFKADSTLSIGGGEYSTKKSGDNIIVTVGEGKISLMGAASLSKVNITNNTNSGTNTSTTLTVTDKTKSPVTVDSAIKTIDASKRTTAIKITGNKLANTIKGGSKADTILGGAGVDKLYGNAGDDSILGGDGNDTIWGGDGADKLYGNAGNDSILGGDGNDTILGQV